MSIKMKNKINRGGKIQGHTFRVVIFLCHLVVGSVTSSDKSPHKHDGTAMPSKAAFHVTTPAALGSDPAPVASA